MGGRYTPRKLSVLLDGLGRTSHLEAAKASDVELAAAMEGRPDVKQRPPLQEFTREHELLIAHYYLLHQILTAVSRLGGAKQSRKPTPIPTPETGREKLARRRAYEAHLIVESQLVYVPTESFTARG